MSCELYFLVNYYRYMSQYSNIPQSINQPNNILDLERYNGRVNIMQPPDQKVQFKMIEKIHFGEL